MGFFSDLKEDLSQAVNDLMPEESTEGKAANSESPQEEPDGLSLGDMDMSDMDLSDMLDKMESGTVDFGSIAEDALNLDVLPEETQEELEVDDSLLEQLLQEESAAGEPVVEEPVAEEPIVEEPVIEEPVAEEPVVEEPVVEELTAEELAVAEETVAEEPAAEEVTAEEAVVEESVVEAAAEELMAEEAIAEETVAEEPAAEVVTTEEPVVEEPAREETDAGMPVEENIENIGENTMEDNKATYEMEENAEKRVATDETALITVGMTIRGDIDTQGSLDLIGKVVGNVNVLGKLNITGTVEGNSKASEVYAEKAHIVGEIRSEGALKIGQNSVIIGNLFGNSAVVAGAVKGDIDVKGPVILDTTAIVMGNIKSKSVQINNGAVIEGMCSQCYADVTPTSFFEDFKLD